MGVSYSDFLFSRCVLDCDTKRNDNRYALGVLLTAFGSICVTTDGSDRLCGAGGEDGGKGMIVSGGILLFIVGAVTLFPIVRERLVGK